MERACRSQLSSYTKNRVWFVVDTDRWGAQLHELRLECGQRKNWNVAQSNPCFEVWLYFHVKGQLPEAVELSGCNHWKPLLPRIIQGGFNSKHHPALIDVAVRNAKAAYQHEGYLPRRGCTQLWQLGEDLLPLVRKDQEVLRPKFFAPVLL
ncbi:RloB family protein [Chitinophaga lutea]